LGFKVKDHAHKDHQRFTHTFCSVYGV
jgi:hypothetical protein